MYPEDVLLCLVSFTGYHLLSVILQFFHYFQGLDHQDYLFAFIIGLLAVADLPIR